MASTASEKERLLDDACAVIEEMGGVGALLDDLTEFQDLAARMKKEYPCLIAKYPDRWVAVGGDGVRAVADSRDGVLNAIKSRGLCSDDVVIEFLDTNPPVLIV